jgi:hypothetical protein
MNRRALAVVMAELSERYLGLMAQSNWLEPLMRGVEGTTMSPTLRYQLDRVLNGSGVFLKVRTKSPCRHELRLTPI